MNIISESKALFVPRSCNLENDLHYSNQLKEVIYEQFKIALANKAAEL